MPFPAKQRLLQLALREGKMVTIHEVDNGSKCNCTCPACGSFLIARNRGKIKTVHFAHLAQTNCTGALESALHRLAKEILQATGKIYIPDFRYHFTDLNITDTLIKYNKCLVVDTVTPEARIQVGDDVVVVDALCSIAGKQLIVEFAKTHFIDEVKKKKLVALGIPCVEFHIYDAAQDRRKFTQQLQSAILQPMWIVNPKAEAMIGERRKQLLLQQEEEERGRKKYQDLQRLENEQAWRGLLPTAEQAWELAERAKKDNWIPPNPLQDAQLQRDRDALLCVHPIMKRLFEAAEVSPLYDHSPDFIDIFINRKRVILRPPEYELLPETQKQEYNELYAAVIRFDDFRKRR